MGTKGRLVWLAGALCLASLSSVAAEGWKRYQNARFGVSADVPAGWKAEAPPENGDGQVFSSPDGQATLIVSGGYNDPASMAGLADRTTPDTGETITYRKRGSNWVVVSGTKGDRIFYRKYLLSCGNGVWNGLFVDYPAAAKANYDAVVGHAAASLAGARGRCN